jgi:hypothetical protein
LNGRSRPGRAAERVSGWESQEARISMGRNCVYGDPIMLGPKLALFSFGTRVADQVSTPAPTVYHRLRHHCRYACDQKYGRRAS